MAADRVEPAEDRLAEASRPSSGPDRLRTLSEDPSAEVRRAVAKRLDAPEDALDRLAADSDFRVRAVIAAHPNTPSASQVRLAGDAAREVRLTLAFNSDASLDALRALARSTDTSTRVTLAQQPWLPHETAATLVGDLSTEVRSGLAEVTAFTDLLDLLLGDKSTAVRCVAARSAELTEQQVLRATSDRSADVREVATESSAVPVEILRRLLNDRSRYVRDAAGRRLRHRPDRQNRTREFQLPSAAQRLREAARFERQPRKPSTKWFKILSHFRPGSDEISANVAWLWQLAKAIDKDPAWTAWWQPSGIPTLELWPLGHPNDARHIERRGDVLHVTGHSAALYTYASRLDREGAGHDQGLVLTEEMNSSTRFCWRTCCSL